MAWVSNWLTLQPRVDIIYFIISFNLPSKGR